MLWSLTQLRNSLYWGRRHVYTCCASQSPRRDKKGKKGTFVPAPQTCRRIDRILVGGRLPAGRGGPGCGCRTRRPGTDAQRGGHAVHSQADQDRGEPRHQGRRPGQPGGRPAVGGIRSQPNRKRAAALRTAHRRWHRKQPCAKPGPLRGRQLGHAAPGTRTVEVGEQARVQRDDRCAGYVRIDQHQLERCRTALHQQRHRGPDLVKPRGNCRRRQGPPNRQRRPHGRSL